jgi:hypothetical protein
MLEGFFAMVLSASWVAGPVPYGCKSPSGTPAVRLRIREATDIVTWSGLDDSSRRAAGPRTLEICPSERCQDPSSCEPFTGPEGITYQRLGLFRSLPGKGSRPARVLLQGWNDADAGEAARSIGGLKVFESKVDGAIAPIGGTISVSEQSEIRIVDDSVLAVADFVWGKNESRYARHRFRIRVWSLKARFRADTAQAEFRTRRKYPSLDETDDIEVIGHELTSIRSALKNGGDQ